jgi:hypothetical protein
MRLFFHHVGQKGASEDFKKTVFNDVPLSIVEENLPVDIVNRDQILRELHSRFPSGSFNCWGVPEGARFVIQNLSEGDCVLLVESARINGNVPALCRVEAFWNQEFRSLSKALWGNDKYPFIFFFRTEQLTLMWIDLLEHMGYKENFDPRGQFYSIADLRLSKFGGAEKYAMYLYINFSVSKKAFDVVSANDVIEELGNSGHMHIGEVRREVEAIRRQSLSSQPKLTGGLGRQLKETLVRPRNAAFVIVVRRVYGYRCIFCGAGLRAPNGLPEVQSAHIYPKALDGSDDVRNGICVCRKHHWAFDVGWMAIADNYLTVVRDDIPRTPDYQFIYGLAGSRISMPADLELAPHVIFLQQHRKLAGLE